MAYLGKSEITKKIGCSLLHLVLVGKRRRESSQNQQPSTTCIYNVPEEGWLGQSKS